MKTRSFISFLAINILLTFQASNAQLKLINKQEDTANNTNYIHLSSLRTEWNNTPLFNTNEATDFDTYWLNKINTLPIANPSWNGGNIDIGGNTIGTGTIAWNNASPNNKKPLLIVLPSAGSSPNINCCPSNSTFIVASAMNQDYQTASVQGHIDATLAIQQLIKNILASNKCDGRVFVLGKSQGGGMSLITTALSEHVLETFVSVPAMTGYTGSGGLNGAWPGYNPNNTDANYIDACNHAKRIITPVTFSLGFGDNVTWYKGQNTAAKNIIANTVYLYHNTNGHDDGDWWAEGTQWLQDVLIRNDVLGVLNHSINNETLKIYPNPTSGIINISSENKLNNIKLYNPLGKLIQTFTVNYNQLELSYLPKGIYLLKITDNTKNVQYQKIIKK